MRTGDPDRQGSTAAGAGRRPLPGLACTSPRQDRTAPGGGGERGPAVAAAAAAAPHHLSDDAVLPTQFNGPATLPLSPAPPLSWMMLSCRTGPTGRPVAAGNQPAAGLRPNSAKCQRDAGPPHGEPAWTRPTAGGPAATTGPRASAAGSGWRRRRRTVVGSSRAVATVVGAVRPAPSLDRSGCFGDLVADAADACIRRWEPIPIRGRARRRGPRPASITTAAGRRWGSVAEPDRTAMRTPARARCLSPNRVWRSPPWRRPQRVSRPQPRMQAPGANRRNAQSVLVDVAGRVPAQCTRGK